MGVIDNLEEGLDPRFLRRFLRGILTDDLSRVFGNSGDKAVTVWTVTGAIIKGPDDNCLATGESAIENYDSLAGLQELHHLRFFFACAPPASARLMAASPGIALKP